jgi:hypothetical protein
MPVREVERMIEIELDEGELERCWTHAEEIVAYYAKIHGKGGSGSYGHNRVSSNVIGVKAEVATSKWLREQLSTTLILEHFWDYAGSEGNGDIEVIIGDIFHSNPLEIKAVTDEQWENVHPKYNLPLKRMVTPAQLHAYSQSKALIVWATTSRDRNTTTVRLRGWNTSEDLVHDGIPVRTICDNIYLEDDHQMRPMTSLPLHLNGVCPVV